MAANNNANAGGGGANAPNAAAPVIAQVQNVAAPMIAPVSWVVHPYQVDFNPGTKQGEAIFRSWVEINLIRMDHP